MKIKKLFVPILVAMAVLMAGCKLIVSFRTESVHVEIGLKREYKIIFVNDLHLQICNDEIAEENRDFMTGRVEEFSTDGLSTADRWSALPQTINKMGADFVVFGGDILDFCSEANVELIKQGLEELEVPYMYLRSDHDVEPYWLKDSDTNKCMGLQNSISECEPVMWEDLGELIILGINYSQNNISKEGLENVKEVLRMGKPVILATHIPFDQADGIELKEYSEKVRDGRHLYWGIEGENYPNENTTELMRLFYSEDSPIVAVMAAHLHDSFEGIISNEAIEHIFMPCYKGSIGVITCK